MMKEIKLDVLLAWVGGEFGTRIKDIETNGDQVTLKLHNEDVWFRFVQIEGGDIRVVTFQGAMCINDVMCMDLDTLKDIINDQCEVHRITTKCSCCGYKELEMNLITVLNEETGYEELLCEDCYISEVIDKMETETKLHMR